MEQLSYYTCETRAVNGMAKTVRELAINDSQEALRTLYVIYFDKLMRFARLYLDSDSDAEEVVSETFLAVWQNRKKLPDVRNFNSYIYTLVRNKAISAFRATRRAQNIQLDQKSVDFFVHTDSTPESEMISREEIELLDKAVNGLSNRCKMAFKLVREDHMKYKEAAAVLDISVKTLESHLANAVKKLRETLGNGNLNES